MGEVVNREHVTRLLDQIFDAIAAIHVCVDRLREEVNCGGGDSSADRPGKFDN